MKIAVGKIGILTLMLSLAIFLAGCQNPRQIDPAVPYSNGPTTAPSVKGPTQMVPMASQAISELTLPRQ